jgi:hypothetical protein
MSELTLKAIEQLLDTKLDEKLDAKLEPITTNVRLIKTGLATLATSDELKPISTRLKTIEEILDKHTTAHNIWQTGVSPLFAAAVIQSILAAAEPLVHDPTRQLGLFLRVTQWSRPYHYRYANNPRGPLYFPSAFTMAASSSSADSGNSAKSGCSCSAPRPENKPTMTLNAASL